MLEREEELAQTAEKVLILQSAQAETHDRLEETLKNIERDNAEKDADLIEANREVEAVSNYIAYGQFADDSLANVYTSSKKHARRCVQENHSSIRTSNPPTKRLTRRNRITRTLYRLSRRRGRSCKMSGTRRLRMSGN